MLVLASLTIALILTLAACGGTAYVALTRGWPFVVRQLERHFEPVLAQVGADVAELRRDVDEMPKTFEGYQKEVQRLHGQAYVRVRRAKAELEARGFADAGVDEVDRRLQLVNGEGGGEGQMPALPEDVAPTPTLPPQPLTWQQRTARYKYGG